MAGGVIALATQASAVAHVHELHSILKNSPEDAKPHSAVLEPEWALDLAAAHLEREARGNGNGAPLVHTLTYTYTGLDEAHEDIHTHLEKVLNTETSILNGENLQHHQMRRLARSRWGWGGGRRRGYGGNRRGRVHYGGRHRYGLFGRSRGGHTGFFLLIIFALVIAFMFVLWFQRVWYRMKQSRGNRGLQTGRRRDLVSDGCRGQEPAIDSDRAHGVVDAEAKEEGTEHRTSVPVYMQWHDQGNATGDAPCGQR